MILDKLLEDRKPISGILSTDTAGIYGIFSRDLSCLPGISLPTCGVIYVGQTRNLGQRNHFVAEASGFHSPRRSLGAILKEKLDLVAIPRSSGRSDTNYQCYSFTADGESRLNRWMSEHLEYSIVEMDGDLLKVERELVGTLQPPLNLTLWPNPQKKLIQGLRNSCKEEARVAWLRMAV